MNIVVAGAGGAIGGHLVRALLDQGHFVRAVDIKPGRYWWQFHKGAQNVDLADCSHEPIARDAVSGMDQCYDLAENMGGIGFIEANRVACAESVEIGIALLRACASQGVERFFFASSACVYPVHLQGSEEAPMLREAQAWPAQPEEGYGFSKLYMEELCRHYSDELGLETRVARFHNVYGAPGSWNDGREKAPAAISRKVAIAAHHQLPGISIWGSGDQLRSYLHVDDCVRGVIALMDSDISAPMNIGSERSITVNGLVDMVEEIAGVTLERHHDMSGAQGVHARNADINMARAHLGWEPWVSLEDGMGRLYAWIYDQVVSGT